MIQSNELVASYINQNFNTRLLLFNRKFISNSNIQNDFQPYIFDKYPIFF